MSNKTNVAQIIADGLIRHGVKQIFAQSLPSMVALAAEARGIRQVAYRTENAGTAMADGYARVSGHAAVVMAQNGPAATLLVPGLAEALKASIPVIALVQDVNRAQMDRNAFQDFDHMGLLAPCTKWVRRVTEAERIADYVDMAFVMATSGRPGPVALLLPADLLLQDAPAPKGRSASLGTFPLDRMLPNPASLNEAVELLAKAKHPLIVAGGGVHLSGACAELAALQAQAHIPVTTTVMGKGSVDEAHPLSIGVTGYAMGRLSPTHYMRGILDDADVVLLVGTRTNQNGTDSWSLYPDTARYIHIDVDGGEIGRNYEALRLAGDAKLTLAALVERLAGRRQPQPQVAQRIAEARAKHARDIAPYATASGAPVRPERLMADMQTLLTPQSLVVCDASYSTIWAACYLRSLASGMRFVTPRGLAGLGWGLPMAIGAQVARPDATILCIVGDGGFGHVWSELETVNRNKLPIVVTVLNNSVLGYQKDAEDVKFGAHTTACYFSPVDHAAIARACGVDGVRVERNEDYLPALKKALAARKPCVIDVVTDSSAYPPITLFAKLDEIRETKRAGGAKQG